MDLKPNLFWAIASIILIASEMSLNRGPLEPLMPEYPDKKARPLASLAAAAYQLSERTLLHPLPRGA